MREDEGLQKALGRYLRITKGEAPARYLITKKIPARAPKNLNDAWELHKYLLGELETRLELGVNEVRALPTPAYSFLDLKFYIADKLTEACCFCERRCGVNRKKGARGECGVGYDSRVSSAFEHIGEEPELIPSGTIFFSGCNFHCCFCQNWDISQQPERGSAWTPEIIKNWIEREKGLIKNVNLVGGEPTPNLHNILAALRLCETNLPIVWNSNMYMSREVMELLDGIVDVYLADFKYGNDECARRLSSVPNYFSVVARNHALGKKHAELLIRHLALPNHTECCSKPVLSWIKDNLDDEARVNIMSQYHPEHRATEHDEINRRLTREEYERVLEYAKKIGLWNIETQSMRFL
ncbi:MAG: radical SAM protein [Candidatus Micrarchaeota archaeon]